MSLKKRYFLKTDYASLWSEVDMATWIEVERKAGFRPKLSSDHPDYMTTCATGGFSGYGHSGKIEYVGDLGKMAAAALRRPPGFDRLPPRKQWEIDKELDILDWDGSPEF